MDAARRSPTRCFDDHREAVRRLQTEVASGWEGRDLVFPLASGRWGSPVAVSAPFHRAVRRIGMTGIRFHDLRHTHATLLLCAGLNPKVVSQRLGHSSVTFEPDTHAHVTPRFSAPILDDEAATTQEPR